MNHRLAIPAAALVVVGFLAWVAVRSPDVSRTAAVADAPPDTTVFVEERDGSAAPCAVPLAWRIARVDPQFGLSPGEARGAVEKAARLWEDAVGRKLFVNDVADGFPVRFVYGRRQSRTEERLQVEAAFQRISDSLDARRGELQRMARKVAEEVSEIEESRRDLQRRADRHNMEVDDWDRRGGAPASVRAQLQEDGRQLQEERRALSERAREVNDHQKRLIEEQNRYNERVREHRRVADSLTTAFPSEKVQSGVYREAVRTRKGKIVSLAREIRIYRFDDQADLVLVAAHELGHALGLGHARESGAVMSETYGRDALRSGEPVLQEADLDLFHARCPGL